MLKIKRKLKSSKSTQTWYNFHLHQYHSFEPIFGSFGLDEKFIKIEAKQSWNRWYWCKCKLYQVWVDLEDLSFHSIFSITLRFHDRLASIFMNFSSSPKDPKMGWNERYRCKCMYVAQSLDGFWGLDFLNVFFKHW